MPYSLGAYRMSAIEFLVLVSLGSGLCYSCLLLEGTFLTTDGAYDLHGSGLTS